MLRMPLGTYGPSPMDRRPLAPFEAAEPVPRQRHGAFTTTWFLLAHGGLAWRGSRLTHPSGAPSQRSSTYNHNMSGMARRWRLHQHGWVLESGIVRDQLARRCEPEDKRQVVCTLSCTHKGSAHGDVRGVTGCTRLPCVPVTSC